MLCIFDSKQLELLLSGTAEIDIEDWRENTEYKGGYYEDHICIIWFWDTVYTMNNAERLKLLQVKRCFHKPFTLPALSATYIHFSSSLERPVYPMKVSVRYVALMDLRNLL